MRAVTWMAALVLGLVLTTPAWAQKRTVNFGGVDPLGIINQPIDTNSSAAPIAKPQTNSHPTFSLKNILPRIGLPGAKPVIGRSNFPTQEGMPGANYLRAFHFQKARPVQP